MTAHGGVRAEELRSLAGPEGLRVGEAAARYALGGRVPAAALLPAGEEPLARLLALAWERGWGVVPWGSGLHQGLGRPPERYDLALDLTRLDRVVDHQPADMTVTVQAGLPLGSLQGMVGGAGQLVALDPPRGAGATLGGLLATNLSGPLRCRYGTGRDLVLGLRVVHADGTITKCGGRVVKNATAYDLPKLYLGAFGTLGVITEATLRLYPRPADEAGLWAIFPDGAAAQALADRILGAAPAPTRVELLDGPAAAACGLGPVGAALLVTLGGVPAGVAHQRRLVEELAQAHGGSLRALASLEAAAAAVQDFPWGPGGGAAPRARWRGGVLPADSAKAVQAVAAGAGKGVRSAAAATVGSGSLRGFLEAEEPTRLAAAVGAARRALESLGGYLVLLEAPEAVRAGVDVWGPAPDGLELMRGIREAFDPRRILNPGRFLVDG